jgi:hypothetical protein
MPLTGPGRPSAGALASPALHLEPRPPPELDDDPVARRLFCELVAAAAPQHFIVAPSHGLLLRVRQVAADGQRRRFGLRAQSAEQRRGSLLPDPHPLAGDHYGKGKSIRDER